MTGTAGRAGTRIQTHVSIVSAVTLLMHGDSDTLTEADQVPEVRLWGRPEHHVDQPEGVKHLYAHPGEGAQQGIVEPRRHKHTHTVPSHISHDAREEEEQVEEGEGRGQAQVDGYGLVLVAPAGDLNDSMRLAVVPETPLSLWR